MTTTSGRACLPTEGGAERGRNPWRVLDRARRGVVRCPLADRMRL